MQPGSGCFGMLLYWDRNFWLVKLGYLAGFEFFYKKIMPKQCYWCGINAETKEHFPPKSFFPEDKRNNLLTVAACEQHNNQFSDLDENFRVYIQSIGSNTTAINAFMNKTVRSLKRPQKKHFIQKLSDNSEKIVIANQTTLKITIDSANLQLFVEKIVRALHYHLHREIVPENHIIAQVSEEIKHTNIDPAQLIQFFVMLKEKFTNSTDTHNADVFSYSYYTHKEDGAEIFMYIINLYENIKFYCTVTKKIS